MFFGVLEVFSAGDSDHFPCAALIFKVAIIHRHARSLRFIDCMKEQIGKFDVTFGEKANIERAKGGSWERLHGQSIPLDSAHSNNFFHVF